jgi:hypothetical protein
MWITSWIHYACFISSQHAASASAHLSAALTNSFAGNMAASASSAPQSTSMFSQQTMLMGSGKDAGRSAAPAPVGAIGGGRGGTSAAATAAAAAAASASYKAGAFGLAGLLPVIRMADADMNTLALGADLTSLGLNLNSAELLHATFASPWADAPARKETDFTLPACYYIAPPTLKTSHLAKFTNETLFYVFYNMPRDQMQVLASKELYNRGWKYHKQLQLWFKPDAAAAAAALPPQGQQPGSAGGGALTYFDVAAWKTRVYQETQASRQLAMNFMTSEEVMSL